MYPMLIQELKTYDWKSVFAYGNPEKAQGEVEEISLSSFTHEDVISIIGSSVGENVGPDWLMVGRLKDDRFFFIAAGCDYTGWGCQEWGRSYVAKTLLGLRLNITAEEMIRMGISVLF